MLQYLRRAWHIAKSEGLKALVKKSIIHLDLKTGLLSPFVTLYIRSLGRRFVSINDVLNLCFGNAFISEFIKPAQVKEEISALLHFLKHLKPKVILEIGTARGGTLFLWTFIASDDATIISIDLPGGPFGGGYPLLRKILYKSFKRHKQRIVLIRGNSHSLRTLRRVKEVLGEKKIDFLFIDGDHSYEGVKRDFEMYSPLVRKGGVIALHDIVPGSQELVGGVPRFWKELKKGLRTNKVIEIVKDWNQGGYGIGLIFKDMTS